jgi:MFS family permease
MLRTMAGFKRQLADSVAAIRMVFENPNLRRLQLALAGTELAGWGYSIAVSIFAYEVGGATDVGILWLLRSVPSGLLSPVGGVLADRFPRERLMVASDLIRAALITAGAIFIWADFSPYLVYAVATANAIARVPFPPAAAAMLPGLSRSPSELTGANVATSAIESVGFFAGPALAGLIVAVSTIQVAFLFTAGALVWSAFFVSRIEAPPREERAVESEREASDAATAGWLTEWMAGFTTLFGDTRLRILVGLLGATSVVVGAVEVLTVALALALLHVGSGGVGYLNAMFGVGAVLGAVAGAGLVGVRRLATPFIVAALMMTIPIALIGLAPHVAVAVVCFALIGLGNTVLDVAGFTLVQRAVPESVLARVFGVLQLTWMTTIGIGAILAPTLIDAFGIKATLIVTGVSVPILIAVFGPRLIQIDRAATAPEVERLRLIRGTPFFAPLPGAMIEGLAARLTPLSFEPGAQIIREGEPGDQLFLIAEGRTEVKSKGVHVATVGVGSFIGEIALLRDVPRTATVTAETAVRIFALERDDFLSTVTSHVPSKEAADSIVASRLTGLNGAVARVVQAGV